MNRPLGFLAVCLGLVTCTVWAGQVAPQGVSDQRNAEIFNKAEQSMALILVGDGGGRVQSVSSGVIIRSDGVVITAYHPLKGAREVQVRLRNGDVYDQVDMIGFDERRDVAALHFTASGLAFLSCATLQEAMTGDKIRVLSADGRMAWTSSDGVLGPVRLADEIVGAGRGYRVIQFMAAVPGSALGGAVINSWGQLVGVFTTSRNSGGQQFVVPAESVVGLLTQGLRTALGTGKNLAPPADIPNSSPAPEEQPTPLAALENARTMRVASKTTFFTPFMLEQELLNNTELRALGLNVVSGYSGGELLVTVDRPLFTYDFTYSLSDSHTGIVLATGKVTALDGPHAAPGIAKKLVEELEKARASQAAPANPQEALSAPE